IKDLTDLCIDSPDTVVKGGVHAVYGYGVGNGLYDHPLYIVAAIDLFQGGEDNGVEADDQVTVFFDSLLHNGFQRVQGDQHPGHGHIILPHQQAHIVKILGRGQGGQFLQYLCNILYGHFSKVCWLKIKYYIFVPCSKCSDIWLSRFPWSMPWWSI